MGLPIIDLRSFASIADLAKALMQVGRDPGFFYLVGHDISQAEIISLFSLTEEFFGDTTPEEKALHCDNSGDLGYTGVGDERLSGKGRGDLKESFYLADPSVATEHQSIERLPSILMNNGQVLTDFFKQCQKTAHVLLEGFAIGMNLERNFLSKHHTGSSYRMRLIHYPAVPLDTLPGTPDSEKDGLMCEEPVDIRAGAHSDYGSLTLLFQAETDRGGLQVQLPSTQKWLDIPAIPGAIVVNIGDSLEFWTAGRLRSTVHRVTFPRTEKEAGGRYSIPFFVQPDREVQLDPIQIGEGGNAELMQDFEEVKKRKGYGDGRPVTAGEHLMNRIKATYQAK